MTKMANSFVGHYSFPAAARLFMQRLGRLKWVKYDGCRVLNVSRVKYDGLRVLSVTGECSIWVRHRSDHVCRSTSSKHANKQETSEHGVQFTASM